MHRTSPLPLLSSRATANIATLAALLALPLSACSSSKDATGAKPDDADQQTQALTYYRDAKAIVEKSCVRCHTDGGIAPFALDTYDGVKTHARAMAAAVASGAMPPWQPDDSCNSYQGDFSLSDADRETLLAFLDSEAKEGDEGDYAAPDVPDDTFRADVSLLLPEAYTPQGEPDDYRCFVVPWTETTQKFITGFQVQPEVVPEVHHVLLYRADPDAVAAFKAMDLADDGPGYTCYGGPVVGNSSAQNTPMNLGSWVPGAGGTMFPKEVGIRIEPGSAIVVQMHYNNSHAAKTPDQSAFSFALADQVARPALSRLITNPSWLKPGGMVIPAGQSDVHHRAELRLGQFLQFLGANEIGLAPGQPYTVHRVGMHMHQLGTRGRVALLGADAQESCLLDIPEWDFHWQGSYALAEPVVMQPDDRLVLECWWDNSGAHQSSHGGEAHEPVDVEWGEGTGDEMCLTGVLVTVD